MKQKVKSPKMKNNRLKLVSIGMLSLLLSACKPAIVQRETPEEIPNEKSFAEFAHCNDTAPFGFPQFKYKEGNYFVCHDKYTLEYNPFTWTAIWASEYVTKNDVNSNKPVYESDYRRNPKLPEDVSPLVEDYEEAFNKADFVPRPLVALENWKSDRRAMAQTSYTTNLFPMHSANKKLWENTEALIRRWVDHYGEAFIISGNIYYKGKNGLSHLGQYGDNIKPKPGFFENMLIRTKVIKQDNFVRSKNKKRLAIPTHIYKIIFFPEQKFNIVFIIPNNPVSSNNPFSYVQSLKTLETMTNIKFYPTLPDKYKQLLYNSEIPKDIPKSLKK